MAHRLPHLRSFRVKFTENYRVTQIQPLIYHRVVTIQSKINDTNKCNYSSTSSDKNKTTVGRGVAVLTGAAILAAGMYLKNRNAKHPIQKNQPFKLGTVFASEGVECGKLKPELPTFTKADVAAHCTKATGIWVTYENGVYDISNYVDEHPGGNKILLGAGKSVEPFWSIYSAHKTEEIYEILEGFRIGNITEVESKTSKDASDPYCRDPERSPLLIPSCERPYNAEPPSQMLADNFVTPNNMFFVRNHLPVPCVTLDDYSLLLQTTTCQVSLSYDDLKNKFTKKTVTAVTQCAGNRRSEMVKVKPVKGLNWGVAAISNAKWSGVSLNDLLKHYGVDIDTLNCKYIVFEGLDLCPDGAPYGASIPLELAKSLKNDIIIAYEMNGAVIPRDHGFPVRVMIPGVVGARQVKWLKKIYFSSEESTSHWQRLDYKGFNSSIDWHNVDFSLALSITQMPVTSAICDPTEGSLIEPGLEEVAVRGYAWSGGGRGIIRVDVSADGGATWHVAQLKPNGQTLYTSYAWTLWEANVPLPKNFSKTTLIAKATDVSYNVQPDSVEGIWNLRGVLSNAWHRVNISLAQDSTNPPAAAC